MFCAFKLWRAAIFVPLKKSGHNFHFGQSNFDISETHVFKDILLELRSSQKGQADLFALIKPIWKLIELEKTG